jgi:ABC-type proline/glycine betaine transport system permease subunit
MFDLIAFALGVFFILTGIYAENAALIVCGALIVFFAVLGTVARRWNRARRSE